MGAPEAIVYDDADALARAVATRLIIRLADAQSATGSASVVLTGGGLGTATLAAVAADPARSSVDWRAVDFWWGDERFLPEGDPERNETGAREALFAHIDTDPARVHVMPRAGEGLSPEAGAEAYAEELRRATRPGDDGPVPSFDVLLLGVGPDAHVASLFPGLPGVRDERPVVAVHDSPKPPPTRISLTLPSIRAAREVWLVAAGEPKAEAIRRAVTETDPSRAPAAGARGAHRTLLLLDRAAAGLLPAGLARPAS